MRNCLKIGVVCSLIGWAVSAAHTDSIQPIVNTSQVLYGSAQRTITGNSAVQVDTTTHVLSATSGFKTNQITFPDKTIITSSSTLGGNPPWGTITGVLSNQTDLQNKFNAVAIDTTSLGTSVTGLQSSLNTLGSNVATSINSLQTQIYAVGITTGNLQTSINVVAGTTANLSTSVASLNLSTASLKTQINAVAADTGTIQTQINAIVVSTAALAVSTASLQTQINGLGTTYLTQSSATVTYLQTSNAATMYLQQSSATANYLQLSSATATYAQNNIFASSVSSGLLNAQDWNSFNSKTPTFPATALAVTTGTLAGFSSVRSSPTAVVNFEQAQFQVSPAGSATAYVALNPSSATLQGNNFNIANRLVQLTAGGQYPALNGNLITNLNVSNIGAILNQSILQNGATFYVSSGTIAGPLTVTGAQGINDKYGINSGSSTAGNDISPYGVSGGLGSYSLLGSSNWGNPFFGDSYGGFFSTKGGQTSGTASYGVAAHCGTTGNLPCYGGYFYSDTGTGNRVGIYASASGGSSNYGLLVAAGQAQINSSMTVTGSIITSTYTATGEYCFKDGSCQTTASSGGGSTNGTITASPRYQVAKYSLAGTTTTLVGDANFSVYSSSLQYTGSLYNTGSMSERNSGSYTLLGAGDIGLSFLQNPGTSNQLYIRANDGITINETNDLGADLMVAHGSGHSYGTFVVQGSSANSANVYSGFTSTNNVNSGTIWSVPRNDGTVGQLMQTDGATHLSFTNTVSTLTVSNILTVPTPIQAGDLNGNVGIGQNALFFVTGFDNSGVGVLSLGNLTTGSFNSAYGYESLLSFNGSNSVAFGTYASSSTTSGVGLVSIGYNANTASGLSYASAIGANSFVSSSNTMQLGGTGSAAVVVSMSSATVTGYYQFASKTLAQLHALVPTAVGQEYYCTDCTVDGKTVSTGTVVGSFSEVGSKTTFPH